ncbi:hypothetical protein BDR07DRAFT_1607462 [Suillus spraguei]|nr:hypothetical protein BDR07DRAFT_1607462 [Suillus spraguei]
MQTSNLNIGSPPVSATVDELQAPLDAFIGEDSNVEAAILNIYSPSVSVAIDGPQKPLDVVIGEGSALETARNGVGYRQRETVDGKVHFIQSSTVRTRSSSTISHLPTEILSEIFLYCLPQEEHLPPASRLAPILLTRICRRWRQVALGFPRLWNNLLLNDDDDDWHRRAFCYNYWLERSRGCPLSLRIEYYGDRSDLRRLLQPYVKQISSLAVDFCACVNPFEIEDFDRLNHLTIRQFPADFPRVINRSLSKLPVNLRSINLTDLLFSPARLDFFTDSAWARLTHIEIGIRGLDAFPRILRLCPNVSSLMITGVFNPIKTAAPITHTNLRSLRMSGHISIDSGEDLGLFNIVTLPELRVVEASRMGMWPHEDFKAFLRRSGCPLEKLVFGAASFSTAQQRAEYATLYPSLEMIVESDVEDQRADVVHSYFFF